MNSALSENGGHPDGQFEPDSDLLAIIEAWPELSAADHVAVARIVTGSLRLKD